MTSKPSTPKPSVPWSRRAAFLGVGVFVALAAWPYLSATTKLVAAGDAPTAEKVKDGAAQARMQEEREKHAREIKAVAALPDGRVFLGNKGGLAVLENGAVKAVDDWPGGEVKHLAAAGGTLWAVSKETVWNFNGQTWSKAFEGEVHSVAVGPDQAVYLGTKKGLKRSRDGAKWEDAAAEMPASLMAKMEEKKKYEKHEEHEKEEKKDREKHEKKKDS